MRKVKSQKSKVKSGLRWNENKELKKQIVSILKSLDLIHINPHRIFCFDTNGSTSRAYARIWAFPKIFQKVLNIEPAYIIEVLSERFDKLSEENKIKVLIHELLHIPKNFSGSLLPHKYGGKKIDREVERLFKMMKSK